MQGEPTAEGHNASQLMRASERCVEGEGATLKHNDIRKLVRAYSSKGLLPKHPSPNQSPPLVLPPPLHNFTANNAIPKYGPKETLPFQLIAYQNLINEKIISCLQVEPFYGEVECEYLTKDCLPQKENK